MSQSRRKKSNNNNFILWQLPLMVVFLIFGMLLVAQYNTYVARSGSLENQTTPNLAIIMKSVNDHKNQLEEELNDLETELVDTQALIDNGESVAESIRNRITHLQTATGDKPITGDGITITITGSSSKMYDYDLIDIINELFVSGAEAVSINEQRFTINTHIYEDRRYREVFDDTTQKYNQESYIVLMLNGSEMLYPIIIKAIGDPVTLENGLDYPGGIIENLNTLYNIYPVIKHSTNLTISGAERTGFRYSTVPEQ